MALKKSKGNMYPWVSHTHCHLGGQCPHRCAYCYVDHPRYGRPERYRGPLRLIESEFDVRYGTGKTIFVENCNDLFCTEVPDAWIARVISHCLQWKGNTYVFQTKNPERYFGFLPDFPDGTILGTTIETNREIPNIGTAPPPVERMRAMQRLQARCCVRVRRFVTIEPVLDFDVDVLAGWIASIRPAFLNLGADSKGHGLPEPSVEKVLALTEKLHEHGIELREKHNLQRLKEVMGDGRDE